jgi:Ca-activated chloride channel family protein
MTKWATPQAWFLIGPLFLLFIFHFARLGKNQGSLKFSSHSFLEGIRPGLRLRIVKILPALKFLAIFLAIVALARPQRANTKVNKNVEGIDIMVAIDVSDSMNIEDMQPDNRITAAKQVIHKFIRGRTSDRVGLVIFAGESYTRCPLTLDYDVLLQSLDDVTTDNIKQGTAIGVALANAVARLKESTAKSRVVILLTDGENNSGTIDPGTATDIAKGYGIKVYTIGVGTNGQAQLPVYSIDAFGRKVKHYQPIHSTVNDELLDRIALETGGKSFRAVDTDALKKVFSTIDQLERTKIQVNEYVKYTELFSTYLFWAVLIYLAQIVLAQTVLRRAP